MKVLWRVLVIYAGFVLAGCDYNPTESTHFTAAEYWQQSPSIVETRPAPDRIALPRDAKWVRVSLPHTVPRPIVNTAPLADIEWVTRWYKFEWQPINRKRHAQAIYIPRRLFNFGDVDVYVDGRHINSSPDPDWNNPQLILIPPDVDRMGGNEVREILIGVSTPPGYGHAMSTIRVGTHSELMWRWDMRNLLQRGVPKGTSIAAVVLGALAFAFWYRRRSERAYLWFALLMPVYAVRSMHYFTIESKAWEDLYWWLTSSSLGWLQVLVYFFAASLHGVRFRSAERFIVIATVVNSAASLFVQTILIAATNISPLFYLVQIVISIVAMVMTSVGAFRSRSASAKFLAVMLWLFLSMGVHDWFLQNWRINVENIFLMPYGALLVVGVSLAAILQRYLAAVNEADMLNASLEAKLSERSRELEASHRKLRVIEHEQAVTGERQRLMREMHDGLGSSLMSSLVMVEQGKLDSGQVATVLRESIDDLKLTIDSLEPMGDDLLTLLGTLRYRLGKRLETAGIKLEWRVAETPPLPWLNPTSSLQILRILQETLTNILKHAKATVIVVETEVREEEIAIRLSDNGIGFDIARARAAGGGRGLHNLERRAASIGGNIAIDSQPGRTAVTLHLPKERRVMPR